MAVHAAVCCTEPAADLAPAAEVSVDSSDSPAVAVCSSPQQDQQQEAPSTTQEPTQHQAAAAADLSAPDAAPADSTVEQPAGSSCEAAPQEPCAVSAAVEEPVGDTSTVTEAEPAPAAVLEAVSTEAVQAVENQQQQGYVIHAPAGAADSQPQPAEACMVPEQQQVAAAAEAPAAVAAQLDSSSVPQQDACSTDVASHAIADMKSELSLAEPSSTVVGQASFLQECSGSSHQLEQQQPAPQQLPAAAPSAAAVAAPEHPPGVPVLELQQPVAPDGAEQSADVVVSSPAELQLVQEDSGLLPVEAEDFEPPLMPEASDEPVLPLGVEDGKLHWLDGLSLLARAWFGLQSLCWPGRRLRFLDPAGSRSQPTYHNLVSACATPLDSQGTRSSPGCSVCLLTNP